MSGFGLLAALVLVLGIGGGVMVFKHHVDEQRQDVARLESALRQERETGARLRAELAYHHRPAYLQRLATPLGLVPATPQQMVRPEELPKLPVADEDRKRDRWLVVLPSGARVVLARRPDVEPQP